MMLDLHYSSATPEWYTPPAVIDAVVTALGAIDLDPCAESERAIPAHRHITREDDGLAQDWDGRVYMNPPYGRGIGRWATKAVFEYRMGRVSELVALVPARVDTAWWRTLATDASCVVFVRGRLHFSGHPDAAPFPSALVYLGPNSDAFHAATAALGDAYVRIPA